MKFHTLTQYKIKKKEKGECTSKSIMWIVKRKTNYTYFLAHLSFHDYSHTYIQKSTKFEDLTMQSLYSEAHYNTLIEVHIVTNKQKDCCTETHI